MEALRQVEVELHRAELPRTAEGVLDLHVDLGAVERAAALVDLVAHPLLVERIPKGLRRLLPAGGIADRLRGLRRKVRLDVVEAELAEHLLRELDRVLDLLHDLLRRAEDVRIVLREAADAEHAVADAVLLVAVDRAELAVADRQVAVRALLELIALDVERAVHRLDVVVLDVGVIAFALLNVHHREHTVLVEAEVARSLPEVRLADVRRVDDLIAGLVVLLAPVVLNRHADACATRQPVREARTDGIVDGKEL